MANAKIAKRYARSLLELANERNELEMVKADIELFQRTINENRSLALLLKSPVVDHFKKENILLSVFQNHISSLSASFFSLVIRKTRENYLIEIADAFLNMYRNLKGITRAKLTTAISLSSEQIGNIKDLVKDASGANAVEIEEVIDEKIIGGFVLRVDDKEINNAVSHKLRVLKRTLTENI